MTIKTHNAPARLLDALSVILAKLPAGDLQFLKNRRITIRTGDLAARARLAATEVGADHRPVVTIDEARLPTAELLRAALARELARCRLKAESREPGPEVEQAIGRQVTRWRMSNGVSVLKKLEENGHDVSL